MAILLAERSRRLSLEEEEEEEVAPVPLEVALEDEAREDGGPVEPMDEAVGTLWGDEANVMDSGMQIHWRRPLCAGQGFCSGLKKYRWAPVILAGVRFREGKCGEAGFERECVSACVRGT